MKKTLLSMLFIFLCASSVFANERPIRKVLLVVALEEEATPIINKLHLKEDESSFPDLPMRAYFGKYRSIEISLILNGADPRYKVPNIGTQAASLTTYLGISSFNPDLVISIGTAGGVAERGARIGDIYASENIYFVDRRMPVSGYYEYGRGEYKSFITHGKLTNNRAKKGIICSGDSFDQNKSDKEVSQDIGCVARDMEAAGVAWVCGLQHIPMVAIKGITDIIGQNNGHAEFLRNRADVTEQLANELVIYLNSFEATPSSKNNR
jgi:5'-methylthioadenosine/S-adenosylhomocysteine nucleosidase